MFNFQTARKNMVDCQIHPSGVINPQLLHAFETVPREVYVSSVSAQVPYADEDIIFDDGRFMMDPTVHARMIQTLDIKPTDQVLDVGCASGYSAAILSYLANSVVALEAKQSYLTAAQKNWDKTGIGNITAVKGDLKVGCDQHAPYNAIILNGAAAQIPEFLVKQLKPQGKMILIVRKPGRKMGHVTLVQHQGNGQYSDRQVFEAAAPYLPGFEPEPEFLF